VIKKTVHIALVGNPNSGKTSLFNTLTGLNQRTGNFPGVTVDKKTGHTAISDTVAGNVIDLPGTYSLYPKTVRRVGELPGVAEPGPGYSS
jgi:ferrous iron transport protein B